MSTADIDIAGCRYVVLSGGVGGAKLAQGLSLCRPAEELLVVGNIGDDFEHWGLHISPDLETLIYTLAGVANPELGWGRAAETWHVLEAVSELGGETWIHSSTSRRHHSLPLEGTVQPRLCPSWSTRPVYSICVDGAQSAQLHASEQTHEMSGLFDNSDADTSAFPDG